MSDETAVERQNYYVGESLNQLRHGFGVYYYKNKFFRYEGDWVKGKKHGHGKLLMADGSYYEGEFKDGEIDGHGFRKWQHSGNCYSGEFCKGEMQGHGVMNYSDETQYQGEFYKNQRHGTGMLKGPGNLLYEGSWYKNKKHGQGIQSFENGDEYEGNWVQGTRQGHGELNCVDGSFYEGQWRSDLFNGQGVYTHVSGVVHDGIWINNLPYSQPTQIVVNLPSGQTQLEVPQGHRFSIPLQLLDDKMNVITCEHGREFKVTAGYKFAQSLKTSQSQSLLELIEDLEAKPIPTPLGYDVLPYPLVECAQNHDESEEQATKRKPSPVGTRLVSSDVIHETTEGDNLKLDDNNDDVEISSSYSGSKQETADVSNEVEEGLADDDLTSVNPARFPPPALQRSSQGYLEFTDLLLPSAPDNYRPFLLEDEVQSSVSSTPTGSTSSLKRGPGGTSLAKKRSKGSRTASAASSSSTSLVESKATKASKSKGSDTDEKGSKAGKASTGSRKKAKETKRPSRKHSPGKSKTVVSVAAKEEHDPLEAYFSLMNSLYAREGDYVIMVEEVTNPPFLGKLLPPAFVVVKVTATRKTPKKAAGKRN